MRSLLTAAIAITVLAATADAVTLYGLGTGNELYRFDSANPSSFTTIGIISQPGIVDIDFHAANGLLYGITSSGQAYNINILTAGASLAINPTTPLSGIQDFDFNPAVDRLRLSGSGNANYRMVSDFVTSPSAAGTSGAVTIDGLYLPPSGVSIVANAYTNAYDTPASASVTHATVLFSIGSDGVLYEHSVGPQFNTMTARGSGLFTPGTQVGFDIHTDGVGGANTAFANNDGNLYEINLANGTASLIGTGPLNLSSIAAVPEPSSLALAVLGVVGMLRRRRA